ncbi:DUF305 domain-containing protein [Janibacter terrae]|uniref:DUF305 domain-containing protein n=1 Tax=Janibacter terrae TaxID=103817 RepID=UPI0008383C4A|nr:DUF305 domain-containing protein [Janibacter terrae]
MRKHTFITSLASAATAALVLTGCASSDEGPDTGTASSSSTTAQFNQADVTYAQGMTMHHQQAVEMSDIVLDKEGVDPDVEQLAREIKKAQGPEITTMEGWLKDWGHPMDHGSGMPMEGGHMDGMVSEQDITRLEDSDGASASRLFLDQMIEHHEGAVDMAEQHRKDGKNPAALELSQDVITDQKAEITKMRKMRTAL